MTSSKKEIEVSYDVSNEFFRLWLDEKMHYTSGSYLTGRETLEEAQENKARILADYAEVTPDKVVLDIGCGEGRHTRAFAGAGALAVGVDLEPKALARAREAADRGSARGLGFAQADVFALPFAPATFDVVLDYGCLHHVRRRDTQRYLEQVVPLLKPGGYFLLSCFSTKFQHHAGERRTRDWLVHNGHYDRFFRRRDFDAMFGSEFDILEVTEDRDGLYVFHNVLMQKR